MAVSGLVLNFVPEPVRAVEEMARVTTPPGGIVAAYVWDYEDGMQLMRYFWEAAAEIDAAAIELDEGKRFAICHEDAMGDLFASAGLRDIATRAIVVPTAFRSFEEYWAPFLGAQGLAPAYAMSLSERDRGQLRDNLEALLPIAGDGSIALTARAWAARGAVAS